jgi:hypothetical protein
MCRDRTAEIGGEHVNLGMRASRRVLTFPRRLPPVWRWALIVVVTVVIALSTTNAVRAKDQPNNASKAPAEKSYILPYILVGLCMGFGIMVVCRPGNRGDKEKMSAKQEFEESH